MLSPSKAGGWRLLSRAPARRGERERVGDDDDTATEGLGELPSADRLDDTVLDPGVAHGGVLEHRGHHLAGGGDGELHGDPAAEVRLAGQLLLVAVLHLVDVPADDAADDLLVQRAAHVGLTGDDVRGLGPTPTQTASAPAVTGPVAAATALADGAQVAETDG